MCLAPQDYKYGFTHEKDTAGGAESDNHFPVERGQRAGDIERGERVLLWLSLRRRIRMIDTSQINFRMKAF